MKKKARMVIISFHCDLALKKALEDRAKKLGWKRNFLIRECLRQYLSREPERRVDAFAPPHK